MLNKIIIQGRLTSDPEKRTTDSGTQVTSFCLAVQRDYNKEETDFINCTAWKGTADFVEKYFHKGEMMIVSGRLQIRSWTDKEGKKRTTPEVVVDNSYFGGSKKESSGFTELEATDSALPF